MPEFTGERVVPGFVDADLFNEHFARYRFAARFCSGKRVLDAGCGTGYGAAELAKSAAAVTAIDLSREAIDFAREKYPAPHLEYRTGDCLSLPDGPFDLIAAFEVIEHLDRWRDFLAGVKRVLAPGGLFLVSTPNKLYYAESRGPSGGNPFHVHEFEYGEFHDELRAFFPHAGILLQNHVEGVAFSNPDDASFHSTVEPHALKPEESHFFLAICSREPLPELPGFVWIPGTGNILRERERHIGLLSGEVDLKTGWLERSKAELDGRNREFDELLSMFRALNRQMEERNQWAISALEESERRGARIAQLQEELAREQANFRQVAEGYEAKLAELEQVNREKTEWALETERRLTQEIHDRSDELARCAALLDRAEQTVIERTLWGQAMQRDVAELDAQLSALRAAKWVKAGRKLKLVPENS